MKNKIYTAIGLMSGTSMDGVDFSLIKSDGIFYQCTNEVKLNGIMVKRATVLLKEMTKKKMPLCMLQQIKQLT